MHPVSTLLWIFVKNHPPQTNVGWVLFWEKNRILGQSIFWGKFYKTAFLPKNTAIFTNTGSRKPEPSRSIGLLGQFQGSFEHVVRGFANMMFAKMGGEKTKKPVCLRKTLLSYFVVDFPPWAHPEKKTSF